MPSDADPVEGVVAVVIRDGRFLMIERAPGVLAAGWWCFVGGAVEGDETQKAAVVREFAEEVGGVVRPVRKIWQYQRPDGKLLLHWWLVELIRDRLRPAPTEVSAIAWLTGTEIRALPRVLVSNVAFLDAVGDRLVADAESNFGDAG